MLTNDQGRVVALCVPSGAMLIHVAIEEPAGWSSALLSALVRSQSSRSALASPPCSRSMVRHRTWPANQLAPR